MKFGVQIDYEYTVNCVKSIGCKSESIKFFVC